MRKTTLLILAGLLLLTAAVPALAQTEAARTAVNDAPAETVKAKPDPGPFAQGRKRVAFFGGLGSTLGQQYMILGAGLGYFVADGLEVGLDVEGWLLQDPGIYKLTPQVRYTFYQAGNMKPYLGAFYRKTWIDAPFEDFNSWGGRAGVAYRSGRNYVAVGVVYERFIDTVGGDSDNIYPEISFWISF